MSVFIVLLRAVNVGGTGKLPMPLLKATCVEAGFRHVETYIASGNLVLESDLSKAQVKCELESILKNGFKLSSKVIVKSPPELAEILEANPFKETNPSSTVVVFLDEEPTTDPLSGVTGATDEELASNLSEIYVHYPGGMGISKLRIPATKSGTARNINTCKKLLEMAKRI